MLLSEDSADRSDVSPVAAKLLSGRCLSAICFALLLPLAGCGDAGAPDGAGEPTDAARRPDWVPVTEAEPTALPPKPESSAAAPSAADTTPNVIVGFIRRGRPAFDDQRQSLLLADLRALGPDAAVAHIQVFLRGGEDLATGQQFTVDGEFPIHASLRALLLDELGRLDPEVAAKVSRELLDGPEPLTVDVQAIALRNVAAVAGEPLTVGEGDYFRRAWKEIAARPEVLDGSCPVSLAALDLAVFLGDEALIGPLFDLRQQAVTPAAAEAIERVAERLVSRVPTAAMAQLSSNRDSFDALPELRARYLARADLAHPAEQQAVRAFLTDPRTEPGAVQAFLLRYPNDDETLAPGLFDAGHESLLQETSRSHEEALSVVRAWQQDPAMAQAEEALGIMEMRLEGLLENAATADESTVSARE